MSKKWIFLLSCEHAVNTIPALYQPYFDGYEDLLMTHRGIDLGAMMLAEQLQAYFNSPLFTATCSRLLIDCNRSLQHPHCFSEISSKLSTIQKKQIIDTYYLPYRQQVQQFIAQQIANNKAVFHLSVHSFTPELNGIVRTADVGLLYDPKRVEEKGIASYWRKALKQTAPQVRVRMNYPYRGNSDGFTTTLRQQFSAQDYAGLELECNQAISIDPSHYQPLIGTLITTLQHLFSTFLQTKGTHDLID